MGLPCRSTWFGRCRSECLNHCVLAVIFLIRKFLNELASFGYQMVPKKTERNMTTSEDSEQKKSELWKEIGRTFEQILVCVEFCALIFL